MHDVDRKMPQSICVHMFFWFQVVPLTTGYLASAGTIRTKGTDGNRTVTLRAGALPDSADPVRFSSHSVS